MVEFEHLINQSEVASNYINLTDYIGNKYGDQIGPHDSLLVVVDGQGRQSQMKRHHGNQLTKCSEWFRANNIKPSTKIKVKFNPLETLDGKKVLHLIPLSNLESLPEVTPDKPVPFQETEPDSEIERVNDGEHSTEIPIALEKQIEDFIESNLHIIEPGLKIYTDNTGRNGRQYRTDVGIIDLLCQKQNGDFLVIELKKGRSSDIVVGQISRYIGWVMEEIAEEKEVLGLILSHTKDKTLKYAVLSHPKIMLKYYKFNIEFIDEGDL